jgi:hypothetical protein
LVLFLRLLLSIISRATVVNNSIDLSSAMVLRTDAADV